MEIFKLKIPVTSEQRLVVHHNNKIKVQNNKEIENMHKTIGLKLFFTEQEVEFEGGGEEE